jgi:hypothetical protein
MALIAARAGLLAAPGLALACGFIESAPGTPTFRQDIALSKSVLYGTLKEQQEATNSTGFVIDEILKSDPTVEGRRALRLPSFIPIKDPEHPPHFLVFCDCYKGEIDPFRGVPVTPAAVGYVKGLLALDGKDRQRLLRYCFDFLDHADKAVAEDAFLEFLKSPDADIGQVGARLPAAKLRAWLRDPKTPLPRLRLYGFLLGNCGGDDDAVLLRELAARLAKDEPNSQIDAILTGATLLAPKEGWALVRRLAGDPSRPVQVRYAALRAARFFHNTRPDFLAKEEMLAVPAALLAQPDMADLPIDYFRQWRCWEFTKQILPLYAAPSSAAIVRRTVLRYALQCPEPLAKDFVVRVRKADPQLVKDMEELLQQEAAPGT